LDAVAAGLVEDTLRELCWRQLAGRDLLLGRREDISGLGQHDCCPSFVGRSWANHSGTGRFLLSASFQVSGAADAAPLLLVQARAAFSR
jgi:hypothetical protein